MSVTNRPEVIAFLNAIKEEPDDDSLRLILADYLEERDDPRGTFLRLETEIASMDRFDERIWDLKKQRDQLWTQHSDEWLGLLKSKAIPPQSCDSRHSSRGLLKVKMTRNDLLQSEMRQLAETECWSWIEEVWTDVGFSVLSQLDDFPRLSRISTLNSLQPLLPRGAAELTQVSFFPNLRHLNLSGNQIGDDGLRALLNSGRLSQLIRLDLTENNLHLPSMERLAQCDLNLKELVLDFNTLTGAGMQALVQAPWLDGLRSLSLNRTEIRTKGITALSSCEALVNLRGLRLARCSFDQRGCDELARAKFVSQIQELNLSHNSIVDSDIRSLNQGDWSSLISLDLSRNPIGREEIEALTCSPNLTQQLKTLHVSCPSMTDSAIQELARSPLLAQLRSLSIQGEGHSEEALRTLFRSPDLDQLQELRLTGITGFASRSLAWLCDLSLPSLRRLAIPGLRIADQRAVALSEAPGLPKLCEIKCSTSHLTSETKAILEERFDRVVDRETM